MLKVFVFCFFVTVKGYIIRFYMLHMHFFFLSLKYASYLFFFSLSLKQLLASVNLSLTKTCLPFVQMSKALTIRFHFHHNGFCQSQGRVNLEQDLWFVLTTSGCLFLFVYNFLECFSVNKIWVQP